MAHLKETNRADLATMTIVSWGGAGAWGLGPGARGEGWGQRGVASSRPGWHIAVWCSAGLRVPLKLQQLDTAESKAPFLKSPTPTPIF